MTEETIKNLNLDQYIQQIVDQGKEQKYKDKAGIYAIKVQNKIVYIGKSTNMIVRIASHMRHICEQTPESESNKYVVLREALKNNIPIEFSVLYYSNSEDIIEDIGNTEGIYIRQYMPILNYQIPKEEDWRRYKVNKIAAKATLNDVLKLA